MKVRIASSMALLSIVVPPCYGQTHTQDGAILGGLAGAIAGGIIGHQNDETPEGALIGGALGAITGGVLGNSKDQQIARQRYYQHQAWQQRLRVAVSPNDVVNMTRRGVSEQLIINQIQSNGVTQRLGTRDIISLHEQGVSENVIVAMQNVRIRVSPPVYQRAPKVVVQKEYHVVPTPRVPHRHYRVYHHHPYYGFHYPYRRY